MEQITVESARELLMEENAARAEAKGVPAPEGTGMPAGKADDETLPSGAAQADAAAEGVAQPDAQPDAAATLTEEQQRSYAEGSVGLGVDIVEIERMARILERHPRFAEQVFSPDERAYCDAMANPATHYALRFAAKEAVVKALGTGFADGIWVHDIEVERTKKGRPLAKLSGRALQIAEEQGVRELSLSLSYTRTDAVACALAVTESSLKASEKRKDPMEELARQFKETRKMLDEL